MKPNNFETNGKEYSKKEFLNFIYEEIEYELAEILKCRTPDEIRKYCIVADVIDDNFGFISTYIFNKTSILLIKIGFQKNLIYFYLFNLISGRSFHDFYYEDLYIPDEIIN